MALEHVEATLLWQRSLAAREPDVSAKYRDRLRTALLTMRENVIPFVRNIHRDVLGLTVHDDSHLDALWQTANCVAGDDFELNPIEAFVFGASILLHDTGLAVAAYSGGLVELRETNVWRDAEALTRAHRKPASDGPLTEHEKQSILFATLRRLHAEQADKLVRFTFKRPNRDEAIPLLQDVGLLDALGLTIGRIAHSHHWNSADLASKLASEVGTIPGFPAEWSINELKIACLLRCADAAHIDAHRAPTMLFAISDVGGVSADHWTFQNKLNALTRSKDKLIFSGGQSFGVDEASSWWLAYDTIQMIDNEIKSCNAILAEAGTVQFAATSVSGIESPRLLSKTVRVEGWTPISAEVKVSDPVHLARTLGGRNLYGSGAIAPVRELLQNAVDAVRARRAHQSRESDWGKIRLIIEGSGGGSSDVWLHVDDTGTGMSERVVTGPLIDFGKSLWSSTLMDEEFPGLRSNAPKLVGKFGIGFFSVFLLGDAVRVITRRFDAGEGSTVVLSFDELTRRPLLRRAATGELPLDYSTRVSVKLSDKIKSQFAGMEVRSISGTRKVEFADFIIKLIASLDVDVEIYDKVNQKNHKHDGKWLSTAASVFLEEICADRDDAFSKNMIEIYQHNVRPIMEADGTIVGRAALLLSEKVREERVCLVSVGGFTSFGHLSDRLSVEGPSFGEMPNTRSIIGVINGDTFDAARARASVTASRDAIVRWAQGQDALIDVERFTMSDRLLICHSLLALGVESTKFPFGFLGGQFVTVGEFKRIISEASFVDIPLSHIDYMDTFEFKSAEKLTSAYFTSKLHPTVAIVNTEVSVRFDSIPERDRKKLIEDGQKTISDEDVNKLCRGVALKHILNITREAWNNDATYVIERVDLIADKQLTGSLKSWVLRFRRGN